MLGSAENPGIIRLAARQIYDEMRKAINASTEITFIVK